MRHDLPLTSRNGFGAGNLLQPLFDTASEVSAGRFHEILGRALINQRFVKLHAIAQVREEFFDRDNTIRLLISSRKRRRREFEKFFHIAHEEIVLIAIVNIEGGASYSGAVEHILHSETVERPLLNQCDEGVAQSI